MKRFWIFAILLAGCSHPNPHMSQCKHPIFGNRPCEIPPGYSDIGSAEDNDGEPGCILAPMADGPDHWWCKDHE